MMNQSNYIEETHRIGRWGLALSIAIMIGIPIIICAVYGVWPTMPQLLATMPGIMAIFGPSGISQVFSYTPIFGSSSYIAFVTGNINNLKVIPVRKPGPNPASFTKMDCNQHNFHLMGPTTANLQ